MILSAFMYKKNVNFNSVRGTLFCKRVIWKETEEGRSKSYSKINIYVANSLAVTVRENDGDNKIVQ